CVAPRDLPPFPTRRSSDLDDLPAMDDDDLRRGQPTVHRAFDEAAAILAGDGLLTYAFDIVAGEQTELPADRKVALTAALARAAGDRKSTRLNSSHVKISYA